MPSLSSLSDFVDVEFVYSSCELWLEGQDTEHTHVAGIEAEVRSAGMWGAMDGLGDLGVENVIFSI